MPFEGRQYQPSEIAEMLHDIGFRDLDLVEMTATILGESQGFQNAYNDNEAERGDYVRRGDKILVDGHGNAVFTVNDVYFTPANGQPRKQMVKADPGGDEPWLRVPLSKTRKILSRDIGLAQINIPARYIGTKKERALYDPKLNLRAAKALFDTRETLRRRRRFNPWYAYTKGWAIFPEWWVYRSQKAAEASGLPREWVATGRYLHQAIVGVANFYARRFGIQHPSPFLRLPEPPQKPTKPPRGDGPRPKENRGRGQNG